ncbi:phenylalanyl-tRNA synthetase beta chain [Methylohalomonas lacus]|uniref:Phenylalanine--tRNA ligase beta subunit n=1 Tax=Methylohalomonas lacus TaxID=398773 RepID=A0AAE3HLX1_9GAMM|nr:phenylalanine--tRNA ligase subunit beta [Methylohalomonas lacus]MCS3903541.1 phenylalanyl-tRNA synthetase beta chain [Methylohalomonas lacus]
MKISLNWLREFVDVPVGADTLAEQLSLIGLEVAAVESVHPGFAGVVVAEVEAVAPHPDADKLRVCQVNAGTGESLQIVCGAGNVTAGMKAPLIQVGGKLPDGTAIKASKLRGVASQGMLCSAVELGLADEADGLWVLPDDAQPGTQLDALLQLDDTVIEIELTPNRGDCASVLGVAREISALFDRPLQNAEPAAVTPVHDDVVPVALAAAADCPRFLGRVVRGIDPQAASPLWLQERLRRAGIRPISVAVDVTQYVMLEYGQPLHAYDLAELHGRITPRRAAVAETLILLDGQSVALDEDFLVIADEQRALGLAGVMGGADSAVADTTADVYLECAWFSPAVISGRGRRLGLQTDASYRFERGVDPQGQRRAIERATRLLIDIAGGQPGPVDESVEPSQLPTAGPVTLRRERLGRLLGLDIPDATVAGILERLGMTVAATATGWTVTPPGYRFDIAIEPDLIEEVIRIHGYDRIEAQHYPLPQVMKREPEQPANLSRPREVLVQRGYQEAITYSFGDADLQTALCGEPGLALANPITSDMSHMRLSLWPGLLQALGYNRKRQQARIRLFETGLRFFLQDNEIQQESVIAGVAYGGRYPVQWGLESRPLDFADLRNDVEALLALGSDDWQLHPASHPALHPGQSAGIFIENQMVGMLGALHPGHQKRLDLNRPAWLFEIRLDAIGRETVPKFRELSRYPSVRRDLALLVPTGVTAQAVLDCIGDNVPDVLNKLELFDVYQGEGIDSGQKSLAVGLTFQKSSSTLTDSEVDAHVDRVITALNQAFGAELRE